MNCPCCNSSISGSSHNNYFVYSCGNCCGIWIPGSEIIKITNNEEQFSFNAGSPYSVTAKKDKNESCRKCPNCSDLELNKRNIDKVTIDLCKSCGGIFFDKGEIDKLIPKNEENDYFDPVAALDIIINLLMIVLK